MDEFIAAALPYALGVIGAVALAVAGFTIAEQRAKRRARRGRRS